MSGSIASSAAVGPPPGMAVRLSSNESPLGPAPRAIAAASAALQEGHRYPDDQAVKLREAIAVHERLATEQVAVGTGSTGLLMDAIVHAAGDDPEAELLTFARAFVVYRLAARNARARYVEVETAGPASATADGYARDVQRLIDGVGEHTRVVVVDNPGNPTGAHLDGDQLRALVDALPEHVTVIVDEAYHQFARGQRGYATVAELALEHPRLLTTRTFSKAYALAGLRVGYLTGPAELVGEIDARRARFNVTAPAQAAALASLADTQHVARAVELTLTGRARMATELRGSGVAVTEGLGNFVTIELGGPSEPVVEAYAQLGIGVRELGPYGMPDQIRVTVGTPEEVDTFLAASAELLSADSAGP